MKAGIWFIRFTKFYFQAFWDPIRTDIRHKKRVNVITLYPRGSESRGIFV